MAAHDPAGETLGDILGRALAGGRADPDNTVADLLAGCSGPTILPLPDAFWWPMFNPDGSCRGTVTVDADIWGWLATGRALAPALARHLDVPVNDVLNALAVMTPNLNACLDSAQGWALVGEYVRAATGSAGNADYFRPTVQ